MRTRNSIFLRGFPLFAATGVALAVTNCSSDDKSENTATGGAVATGGVSTGGVSTGGVSTGGIKATGGVSTGGVSTGGVSTGGSSTGGSSGGVSTGGSGGSTAGSGGSKSGAGGTAAGAAGKGGASPGGAGGTMGGGGAGGNAGGSGGSTGAMTLTSPDHMEGAKFADAYTCALKGFNGSIIPELHWTPGPTGTKSYALTFIDVTLAEKGEANGYHWVLYNIPTTTTELPEGFKDAASIGAKQNSNFLGPCPNFGGGSANTDTYEFTLYALDTESITISGSGTSAVRDAEMKLEADNLAKAKLTGTSNASPP
jgi:Raf kinase inhibitor-like YbhB/YbcL family protein